jgi:hypothetical protein
MQTIKLRKNKKQWKTTNIAKIHKIDNYHFKSVGIRSTAWCYDNVIAEIFINGLDRSDVPTRVTDKNPLNSPITTIVPVCTAGTSIWTDPYVYFFSLYFHA